MTVRGRPWTDGRPTDCGRTGGAREAREGVHPRQHLGDRQTHHHRRRSPTDRLEAAARDADGRTDRHRRTGAARPVAALDDRLSRHLQQDRRHLLDHFRLTDVAHKVVGVGASAPGPGSCCWSRRWPTKRCSSRPSRRAHLPRLAPRGHRRRRAGLLRAAALRLEDVRRHRDARSGDRFALAAYLGKSDRFDQAITTFATTCATQNTQDHQTFTKAVTEGRVRATSGV